MIKLITLIPFLCILSFVHSQSLEDYVVKKEFSTSDNFTNQELDTQTDEVTLDQKWEEYYDYQKKSEGALMVGGIMSLAAIVAAVAPTSNAQRSRTIAYAASGIAFIGYVTHSRNRSNANKKLKEIFEFESTPALDYIPPPDKAPDTTTQKLLSQQEAKINELTQQLEQLNTQIATISTQTSNIQAKQEALDQRDSDLHLRAQELKEQMAEVEKQKSMIKTTPEPQSSPAVTTAVPSPPPPTRTVATQYRYRRIQFVATGPGKRFDNLSHLGEIVTEQVPGKAIVRYMVAGNFSDGDVSRIKRELAGAGYKGAFEK
jgi:TolA-binding protein